MPKNGVHATRARARASDRGDPQSISGIDASCARPSLEHTAARFRDLVVLASTRARTTGVTRAREPRRFAETRFPRTAGAERVPGTMASDGGDLKRKVRPRIDHGKTSTPTSRRRDPKLVASSVTLVFRRSGDCRFRRRKNPTLLGVSERARVRRNRNRSRRARRARAARTEVGATRGRDDTTRTFSHLSVTRARASKGPTHPSSHPSLPPDRRTRATDATRKTTGR